jgi:hypothetical protein
MLQLAVGSVGHRDLMRAIELLGTEVATAALAATAAVRPAKRRPKEKRRRR